MVQFKSLPPVDLQKRKLPIKKFDGQLFRISKAERGEAGVIYFGRRMSERFHAPDGKFGVCYFGEDEYAAFIETFGQARQILLDLEYIRTKALSELKPARTLRLVDITAHGAA